jgi:micrococcal nuclease
MVILCVGCGNEGREERGMRGSPTIVLGIRDGDTLSVRGDVLIDLAGIDAPDYPACHARLSAWILRRIVPPGTSVTLRADKTVGVISQGRPLRFLFHDGMNVNLVLVQNGAANAYLPRHALGRWGRALVEAARRAQFGRREAWGACTTSTSPFRRWHLVRRPPDRSQRNCDSAYPTVCIPSRIGVGDLDCRDIPQYWNFEVRRPDPHRLDPDGDGIGCPR